MTNEEKRKSNAIPIEFRKAVQLRLHKNMKRLMERDKLTIYDIEASSGIAHGSIWRWMFGYTLPTIDKLLWMVKQMGWNVNELLGKGEEK